MKDTADTHLARNLIRPCAEQNRVVVLRSSLCMPREFQLRNPLFREAQLPVAFEQQHVALRGVETDDEEGSLDDGEGGGRR